MGNVLKRFTRTPSSYYTQINPGVDPECPAVKKHGKKVVVITGCDSGLGYSLSLECDRLGLTVVSGCLNLNSEGAKSLAETSRCHVWYLDVTDSKNVGTFLSKVRNMTKNNEHELHAVVNNAGVMIFGEFEWYTERQITQQVEVNMLGSMRMAKAFLPLLRKHKGRLINITSHCALFNLPSLSVYGATKAAIQNWSNGLRLEQTKYGVKVISFIPGSFISQSNILGAQRLHSEEMERNFSSEDKLFYGEFFKDFNGYLRHVAGERKPPLVPLEDEALYEKFSDALLSENPKPTYKNEPWRYFFYYNALQVAPFWLQVYLVKKFLKFPHFKFEG